MKPTRIRFTACLWLMGFVIALCHADIVHLKTGGKIEGTLEDLDQDIRVHFPTGSALIHKSDIERIESKITPEVEFAVRLQKAAQDPAACLELAKWAKQQDLTREYVLALRTALQLDGTMKEARQLLREFEYQYRQLPANRAAADKLLAETGADFQLWVTPHYRIAYNSTSPFADVCGELLEQVYEEFGRFFRTRLFELAPLTDRLEVVLFDNRSQFDQYIKDHMTGMAGAAGFYSSKTNRSYFYDAFHDTRFTAAREEILKSQDYLARKRREIGGSQAGSTFTVTDAQGNQRALNREEALAEIKADEQRMQEEIERLKKSYQENNYSVSVHEAVHQLAYNTGIHSRYSQNPLWLVEGLATYFEAPSEGRWNGAGQINPNRLKLFLDPMNRHIPLADLITDDTLFNLSGTKADMAYASTWALFYYLAWQQHEQLFDYIYLLSVRNTLADYPADQRIKDFETHFGSINAMELHWHRTLRTLADTQKP